MFQMVLGSQETTLGEEESPKLRLRHDVGSEQIK